MPSPKVHTCTNVARAGQSSRTVGAGRLVPADTGYHPATCVGAGRLKGTERDAEAYRYRGVAYGAQGEPDRAFGDLGEAIRLDPSDAVARYNRGVAYSQKEDYDAALADFGEAIRLNPSYAKAYLARSRVYAKKGDNAQAKADERKVAELAPASDKSGGANP